MRSERLKKKVKLILCLLLVFCYGQVLLAECGDVNASEAVDIVDALMIAQDYVGLDPVGFDSTMADVNADGTVSIIDALIVAQYYVGLVSVLECEAVPTPTNPDQLYNCYYVPEWNATAIYDDEGTLVQYNGIVYQNNWYSQDQNPEENSGELEVWSQVGTCDPDAEQGTPTPTPTQGITAVPTETPDPNRTQEPYPIPDDPDCNNWVLVDNVCCGRYCSDDLLSENCDSCDGTATCVSISSKASKSGAWPEVHEITGEEPWQYSRSTHYGIGKGGACAFGLYNICTSAMGPEDAFYNPECEDFCIAYPDLCADPAGTTFRGNWVAPPGNYYTQFWASLPGARDNYLSCGECYEIVRVKPDGSEYQPEEEGYTDPVTVTIADSCPCAANTKWCCGSGRDHCYEVEDFEYGCQIPPGLDLDPTLERDPLPGESIHIDLCSIAMARLQSGDASGGIVDGIIPIKYRRVECPVTGNIHVWLLTGASQYYLALTVVNVAGLGAVTSVEAQMGSGEWATMERDPNFNSHRPQERFGTWVTPSGSGPFDLPISLRFTNAEGTVLQADNAITAWESEDANLEAMYFVDTGVQF